MTRAVLSCRCFLPSFGDYKGAGSISYALAPAFAVFGATDRVARLVAALFGLAAAVLVGLIGYRRAGPWGSASLRGSAQG